MNNRTLIILAIIILLLLGYSYIDKINPRVEYIEVPSVDNDLNPDHLGCFNDEGVIVECKG